MDLQIYVLIALTGALALALITRTTSLRFRLGSFVQSRLATSGVLALAALLFWPTSGGEAYEGGDALGLIRALRVVVFVLLFAWCFAILCKARAWPRHTPLNWYVLYVAACAASTVYSLNPLETAWKAFELSVLILFAYAIRRQLAADKIKPTSIVDLLSYTCLGISLFAIVGWALFPEMAHGTIGLDEGLNRDSVWGIFPRVNPNMLGQIGAVTAFVGFTRIATRKRIGAGDIFQLLIGFTALLLAHSRTSLGALLVAMLFVSLFTRNRRVVFIVVGAVSLGGLVAGDAALEYLSRGQSQEQILSLTGRLYIWAVAWNAFLSHPWFGAGFYAGHKYLPDITMAMEYSTVDNTYLESLVDVGVVGTTFLVSFVASTFLRCIGLIKKSLNQGPEVLFIASTLTGIMVIMIIRSFTGPSFQILHLNALFALLIVTVVDVMSHQPSAITRSIVVDRDAAAKTAVAPATGTGGVS